MKMAMMTITQSITGIIGSKQSASGLLRSHSLSGGVFLIFPKDVHKRVQEQNKLTGDNKVQLFIVLFVLGNVIGFFLLNFCFSTFLPGVPFEVVVGIQVTIMGCIGVTVFRFVIFDEDEKKKEYKDQQSDSFAKYMYLRKDVYHDIELGNRQVRIFEFANGTASCVLEFRFGSNNDAKAQRTDILYQQMVKIIADYGFEFRFIVMPENFRTSKEFTNYINSVNKIEDVDVKKTILEYTNDVMDISYRMSTTDAVYLIIRSVTNYQQQDLEQMIRKLILLFSSGLHAFRDISFLNSEQLLEFYREFYGIAAIDLAMMRTIELANDIEEDFSKVVKLYSLRDYGNKVYKVDQGADVFKVKEHSL